MLIIKSKSEKTIPVMQGRFMYTSDCPLPRMCQTTSDTFTARNRARFSASLRRRGRGTKHNTITRFRAGVRNTPAIDRMITSHLDPETTAHWASTEITFFYINSTFCKNLTRLFFGQFTTFHNKHSLHLSALKGIQRNISPIVVPNL